ncbi:hypothetical protein [Maribellus comscasis]|nr:hypothetical protein [Maribellus comscasis]
MKREHAPSDAFPGPGEFDEDFQKRIKALRITAIDRPHNADDL